MLDVELIFGREWGIRNLRYYWPNFLAVKGKLNQKRYTIFWTTYWGLAFLLLMIFLLAS